MGINPYPSTLKFKRENIKKSLASLGKQVSVAGRLMSLRSHGNVVFADIVDESCKIQLFFQKKSLGEKFKFLKFIDQGDFFEAKGKVIKTVAGEISIDVLDFQLLTKTINPLPSTWFGLKDEEDRWC